MLYTRVNDKMRMRKSRRMLVVFGCSFFLLLSIVSFIVSAHSPSNIELSYDIDTQILSIDISHSVADPNNHYIKEVEIEKNGEEYMNEQYTSQQSSSSFTDTYVITDADGDSLKVTGYCSISSSISGSITVGSDDSTNTSTPGFELIMILSAIGLALVWKLQH